MRDAPVPHYALGGPLPLVTAEARRLAGIFKALSDPVRLRLLSLVASHPGGEACVCHLVEAFDLTQPTISHHLKVLKDAGLVDAKRHGAWVYYRVRPEAFPAVRAFFGMPAGDGDAGGGPGVRSGGGPGREAASLGRAREVARQGEERTVLPWAGQLAGRIDEHVIVSGLLRGNPLGDPHERPLLVYTPPGYDAEPGRRYPAVYVIQGYAGQVVMWRNRSAFRQPFTETADAVFASGEAPPAIVVYVDAWTAYGGSQFVDSPGTGMYHSYLCDEVVPWVDSRYRTVALAAGRAIMGKSSGGFGAMITPMLRPDLFGALATHAGDALYELCYIPEFGSAVRHLRKYDGDIFRWWGEFRSRVAFTRAEDMPLLSVLGVAACFSAREDGTPELPFDPVSGVIRQEVWQRWLDWDPVRMAPGHAGALRSLHSVWIDAGDADDFSLDVGAAAFRQALGAAGVGDDVVRYEIFPGTHAAIDYRYPMSLAWLCQRMCR